MHWITDDPTFPGITGILLVIVFGFFFVSYQSKQCGIVALTVLAMTIGLVVVERVIVTDNERLRNALFEIAECVRTNNVNGLLSHTSKTNVSARTRMETEMPDYLFRQCRISGIRKIEINPAAPDSAVVDFIVQVDVNAMKRYQYDGHARRRVILDFKKETDGVWRVTDFTHRDPISNARL